MLVPTRYALTVAAAVVILAGCATAPAPQPAQTPTAQSAGALRDAAAGCGLSDDVQLNPARTSLTVDTKGPQENAGASLEGVKCVLDSLKVPGNIQSMMKLSTSPGEDHVASWQDRTLSWSYDPET